MVWVAGELDDVGGVVSGALVTAASAIEGAVVAASRVLVTGATVVEGPFEIGSPVGWIKRPVAVARPVVVCDTVEAGLLWANALVAAALVAGEACVREAAAPGAAREPLVAVGA
jgi:hypothetical protein